MSREVRKKENHSLIIMLSNEAANVMRDTTITRGIIIYIVICSAYVKVQTTTLHWVNL